MTYNASQIGLCRRFYFANLAQPVLARRLRSGANNTPEQRLKAPAKLVNKVLFKMATTVGALYPISENYLGLDKAFVAVGDQNTRLARYLGYRASQKTQKISPGGFIFALHHRPSQDHVVAIGIDANGEKKDLDETTR